MIKFSRVFAMPNHETFKIKPIYDLIMRYKKNENTVDPFAKNSKIAEFTNDIDTSTSAECHLDAVEFLKRLGANSVDMVLLDPPYSSTQVKEHYEIIGRKVSNKDVQSIISRELRQEIVRITKPGSVVISFGWNSNGIGKKYGFETVEIMLVQHGGSHNDTICTVERRLSGKEKEV